MFWLDRLLPLDASVHVLVHEQSEGPLLLQFFKLLHSSKFTSHVPASVEDALYLQSPVAELYQQWVSQLVLA